MRSQKAEVQILGFSGGIAGSPINSLISRTFAIANQLPGNCMEDKRFSILKYFRYEHLPTHLQVISKPFSDLANNIVDRYNELDIQTVENKPDIAETIAGLRKLLEAKDCIVRSLLGVKP